jgi:hypothetical protein
VPRRPALKMLPVSTLSRWNSEAKYGDAKLIRFASSPSKKVMIQEIAARPRRNRPSRWFSMISETSIAAIGLPRVSV